METGSESNLASLEKKDFGKALCIITGASKGFGRCLAQEMSTLLKPGSVLILVARSADKLRELETILSSQRDGLVIRCVVADLGQNDAVESVLSEARKTSSSDINSLFLFNNAASLGDVSRHVRSFTDVNEVNEYLSMNVSSALCLTAGILQLFPADVGLHRCVVNVSSLCALQPFPSWVLYCTGKAARNMMFRVLAKEECDLRVLNYAPGPLETDMQVYARTNTADEGLRTSMAAMHSEGRLLTCEVSVGKLIKVLLKDDYESGAHLDFYDL
ncbi:Sepiapterin reductase [Bagarius yarrelli]|uniref:Sepiapterin reductase n=1 Tax=Bagarius yarrelli TaxID=175774 RepID=A0A556TYA2_BAGYA|nr:Sepiapterin reductase [Bagarius yarrelli]